MPNRLIEETSPYLLQHAHNPVDWYAWGPEALEKARNENKPIFLSIGYTACHWCHVMERESFEDPEIAQMLNDHFVSIKVDREERPDLDGIYMNAVVAMTGQGGWPMTVFLTPDGRPFFGGTYFPPQRRFGMPSFREVITAIGRSWQSDQGEIQRVGDEIAQHLRQSSSIGAADSGGLSVEVLAEAEQTLLKSYDWKMGGWGTAPRFPQPMTIEFLMMQAARGSKQALLAASHALRMMSRGGMYDVVGGGFHRYSVDDHWLVPHFEKMLYDNAQLALAYLHAHLLTGSVDFRQVCVETLDFILREMTHSEGGFYSSLDADSEGVEGKFYVWSREEIEAALPDAGQRDLVFRVYPVSAKGNFEGKNILQRTNDLDAAADEMGLSTGELIERLAEIHARLLEAREKRVRPMTDDKVLVMWNALTLRAFAQAARYLKRADYLEAAQKNANFLLTAMMPDGRLVRAWRDGKARHDAYLEDHAALILGLLDLYQSDPNPRWYQTAKALGDDMAEHFYDPRGGFFDTRADSAELIARPKEIQDNATPSGNALAAGALLYLTAFEENEAQRSAAEGMLGALREMMVRYPTSFGMWLQGADFAAGPVRQIAVIGSPDDPETQSMTAAIWQAYRPRVVAAFSEEQVDPSAPELLHERGLLHGKPTAYVCEGFTCNLPVNTTAELLQQLG